MMLKHSFLWKLKSWLKSKRYSENPAVRLFVKLCYKVYTPLWIIRQVLINKQYRSVFVTKIFRRQRIHQTTVATMMNRYPLIFSAAKEYFEQSDEIRILSFGCSTGEEVLTLRHYFPNATIIGAEVNPYCLEICKQRKLDDEMFFVDSTDEEIEKYGPYDLIFCMAVFQRTPQKITREKIQNIKRLYPFEKFEKQVCKLDQNLKEKGLLVIHYAQYDFADTSIFDRYDVYGNYCQEDYRSSVFDKNGCLITNHQKRNSIFVKRS